MHKPLSYMEIYSIAEEVAQLTKYNSRLQSATGLSYELFSLKFFNNSDGVRYLHFDLTPARPLMVSTSSPLQGKKFKPTPVQNFLEAHFLGLEFYKIESAQKPNRILKLYFRGDHEGILEWHGYPHKQRLILQAKEKKILWPKNPQEATSEEWAFVEINPVSGWSFNNQYSPNSAPKINKVKVEPRISKIQKTLDKMAEGKDIFFQSTHEKIKVLEEKTLKLKMEYKLQSRGGEYNKIYDQIKKHRRALLEFGERRNRLEGQLKILMQGEALPVFNEQNSMPQFSSNFKGIKIVLSSQWQLWVGRNAHQNDELVKFARPHEIWIHLRDYPGAHGLLRGPKNKEPEQKWIDFACRVVAQMSQSKKSPFSEGEKLEFVVVPRKFIKKTKGSPPGQVTVEREKIRCVAYKRENFITS